MLLLLQLLFLAGSLYLTGGAKPGANARIAYDYTYDTAKKGGKPTTEQTLMMVAPLRVVYKVPEYTAYDVPYEIPEYKVEAVVYDPPVYEEMVAEAVVYDPPVYEEMVAEIVVYDPPVYEEMVAEAVVYDPPVYEEMVAEAVVYDPPVYVEKLVAEAVVFDPPVYEAKLVAEAVVYDSPVYVEKLVAEAVVYDPPVYVEKLVADAVAYDPPVYVEKLVAEDVAYDPPVYVEKLFAVAEAVVYDPPVYVEKLFAVAEAVVYDPPVYEEKLVAEAVVFDPPVYEKLIAEKVVYDPPEYAYMVDEKVVYDPPGYDKMVADVTETTSSPVKITPIQPKQVSDIGYMKQLFSDFIEASDSKIRPVINQSEPINVHTKFVPISVVRFDTTIQKFSILAYFRVFWTDEFISWKPRDYNGLYFMKVPTTDIWKPNLIIQKPFGGDGEIGNEDSDIASISWLGNVQWVPDGTYSVTITKADTTVENHAEGTVTKWYTRTQESVVCDVNIQYYPFDEQVCTISYYMADETYNTLELTHDAEVDMSELSENSAWTVSKLTVNTYLKDDVFYIDVDFHLQRRPNFTTFTLIMPLLMLAFLNVCIFLVPADSGEKGGFAITIFLSYGIFISILSDSLPNNSIQTSYFVIFVSVLLGLSVLSVFYVILQAKMIACMGVKESLIKCFIPEYMKGKEKVDGAQRSMNQFLNASTPSMKHSDAGTAWTLIFHKIDMVIFFTFLVIVLLATTIFFCLLLRRVSESDLGIVD